MQVSIAFLWTHFHELIKFSAKKASELAPDLDPEDVVQTLLIRSHEHDWIPHRTKCRHTGKILPIHPSHVHRFVRSRSLDLARNARLYRARVNAAPPRADAVVEVPEIMSLDAVAAVITNLQMRGLTEKETAIVLEKAFPSEFTVRYALTTSKRGNTAAPVRDRHIAKMHSVSPATVSRVVTKARHLLEGSEECMAELK